MKPTCKFCAAHHDADEPHPAEAVRAALAELRRTEPKVSAIEVGRKTFQEAREHVEAPRHVTKAPPIGNVTAPSGNVTAVAERRAKQAAWEAKNKDRVREANRERQQRRRAAHSGAVDGMSEPTS